MELHSLRIQGFRSFQKAQTLEFPKQSDGFFMLGGVNHADPDLGANGTGKSTIWDALTWVVTGKTTRNLRASNVANWERSNPTEVELDFSLHGEAHTLLRTWSPNTLLLNGENIVQEDLEKFLGVSEAMFRNTMVMSQFGSYFLDMGATEKLNLFSEVLGLGYWVERAQAAKLVVKELRTDITSLTAQLNHAEGGIEADCDRREELEIKSKQYEEEFNTRQMKAREALALAQRDLDDIAIEVQKAQMRFDSFEGSIEVITEETQELEIKEAEKKGKLRELRTLLNTYPELENPICNSCRQPVDDDWVEKLGQEMLDIEDAIEEVSIDRDDIQEKIRKLAESCRSEKRDLAEAERTLSKLEGQEDKAVDAVDRARLDMERYGEIDNLYEGELAGLEERLKQAYIDKRHLKAGLAKLQEQEAHFDFWVLGFKDIRLWVVEEALTELEVSTNNALDVLGLEGWTITFDIERATKSGGVSKGFQVLVQSPHHDGQVPWEAWSGGEGQRLRLAGNMGLADLASNRSGFRPSVEVWDEPTTHLSGEGIEDLLDLLHDRARSQNRQVWLVDHRSLEAGRFDGRFMVVKDTDGSRIER